jgi:VWFA-related protein
VPPDFVEVTGVDASNFDTVTSFVNVDTAAGKNGTLTKSEFTAAENGKQQQIKSVNYINSSNGSSGTATDIVFTIDRSGSMSGEINTVRQEAKNMSNRLSNSGRDVRFGLVTFEGTDIRVDQNLTRNVSDLEQSLDNIRTSGGTEYNYDALDTALGMDYRPGAQKVLIDITDEDADRGTKTQQDIAQEINQRGINYIAVSPDFGHGAATTTSGTATVTDESGATISSTAEELDKAVLASQTSGEWYDVDNPNFSTVLTNITGTLSNTYEVTYESTIPRANATNRTVRITVDDPNAGVSSDSGTYNVNQTGGSPADFQVSNVTPDGVNVTHGGLVNVTADVENVGSQGDSQLIEFYIDANKDGVFDTNERVGADIIQLDANESTTVEFNNTVTSLLPNRDATYDYGVSSNDDTANATLTIKNQQSSSPGSGSGGITGQTVALTPSSQSGSVGGNVTYDVVVKNVTDGVGVYNYSVSTSDVGTATITDVTLQPSGPAIKNVTTAADGSSAKIDASLASTPSTGNVTISRITITGQAAGSANIDLTVNTLGNANGTQYTNSSISNASVQITSAGGPGDVTGNGQAAKDPDGDGAYEDINGNGQVDLLDVQVLFANLNQFKGNTAFDINDNGSVNLLDVQALFQQV